MDDVIDCALKLVRVANVSGAAVAAPALGLAKRPAGVGLEFRHHRLGLDGGRDDDVNVSAADMRGVECPRLVFADGADRLKDRVSFTWRELHWRRVHAISLNALSGRVCIEVGSPPTIVFGVHRAATVAVKSFTVASESQQVGPRFRSGTRWPFAQVQFA